MMLENPFGFGSVKRRSLLKVFNSKYLLLIGWQWKGPSKGLSSVTILYDTSNTSDETVSDPFQTSENDDNNKEDSASEKSD